MFMLEIYSGNEAAATRRRGGGVAALSYFDGTMR
jgi:hypothetical protein